MPRPGSSPAFARGPLLAALALVFAASVGVRVAQLQALRAEPERHFAGEVPAASTDSYLWLRLADEQRQGAARGDRDPLRHYPDGAPRDGTPALSRLVAAVASLADTDVYTAALWLVPLLASLFVWPVGLAGAALGAPLAGLGGALLGTTGYAYLARTAAHRVDTDGGNVFFAWLVALVMLALRRDARLRDQLVVAGATALAVRAFVAWYAQPGFAPVYVGAFALHLAVLRVPPRRALACLALFALVALPGNLLPAAQALAHFIGHYVTPASAAEGARGGLVFPGVLSEIQELQRLTPLDSLWTIHGHPTLSAVGLAGFAALLWRRPRLLAPVLPLLALTALGFLRAHRFLMFATPLVGMGWGFWIGLALATARRRTGRPRSAAASLAVGLAALAALLPASGLVHPTRPSIEAGLLRALRTLRERLPPDAVVLHTWGHGYLVSDLLRRPTFDDGEAPDPVVQYLLSGALASPDPTALHRVAGVLVRHGRRDLAEQAAGADSARDFLARLARVEPPAEPPVVLLLTGKMLREFSNTWRKATWNFDARRGARAGYDRRRCRAAGDVWRCEKPDRPDREPLALDADAGRFGGAPLARLVRVVDGEVARLRDYGREGGLTAQLLGPADAEALALHLIPEPVYRSAFNQLFVLGRADPAYFRELLDAPPYARAWELRSGGRSLTPRAP